MLWQFQELIDNNEFSLQGNDQVRFEMTYYALYPSVQVSDNEWTVIK